MGHSWADLTDVGVLDGVLAGVLNGAGVFGVLEDAAFDAAEGEDAALVDVLAAAAAVAALTRPLVAWSIKVRKSYWVLLGYNRLNWAALQ